jgi:hypothetical protein
MARAYLTWRHRQWKPWVLYTLLLVLFTGTFLIGMDRRYGLATRLGWSLVFAIVPTLLLVALVNALTYRMTARGARIRLPEGSVLETTFDDDDFVVSGPLSVQRIRYRGVQSVHRQGDFVFLRQVGTNVVNAFPGEVFPDEAVDRIRAAAR